MEETLCCCCLLRTSVKDLRTPYTRRDTVEIFSEMLDDCFQIQLIFGNDTYGICEECAGRLRDASDFKLQVQRSQAKLRERLGGALQVKDEDPLRLAPGGERAPYEVTLVMSEPVREEDEIGERICYEVPLVKSEPVYEEDETSAETCPAESPVRSQPAAGAARGEHSATRARGEQLTHKMGLVDRAQTHEETSPSRNIRSKTFATEYIFVEHSRTRGPVKCEICNKQFTRKSHLNSHMKMHTGQKPYECEICNKLFTEKSSLNNHMKIHTGEKPYKCEICNKEFTRKSLLDIHMRIHTGQKPYKCEICNKRFTENSSLHKHNRIHTGQKPYKCEICNKQFTQKSHLNKHMRIHAGQKS